MTDDIKNDKLLRKVQEQIRRHEMAKPGEGWLLAVSGGCDSMAMMHAITLLSRAKLVDITGLYVAHLNHHLRGEESDRDEQFVSRQAAGLSLEVVVGSSDIGKVAEQEKMSLEAAARRERYRFLAQTARRLGCQKIATGHNGDDNVETVLQRIIRGTGIRGLVGIPAIRQLTEEQGTPLWLVRPMLGLRRCEIESFIQQNKIEYRTDMSNYSLDYTRNIIRRKLLPELREKYNPDIDGSLLRLAEAAGAAQKIIATEAAAALKKLLISRDKDAFHLDAVGLSKQTRIVRAEIIHQVLLALEVPLGKYGSRQIEAIQGLVDAGTFAEGRDGDKGNNTLQLPQGRWAKRVVDSLIITTAPPGGSALPAVTGGEIVLAGSGKTAVGGGYLWYEPTKREAQEVTAVSGEIITAGKEYLEQFLRERTARQEVFDADKIVGMLRIRVRKMGDCFYPLGSAGGKKLGDFLTDRKVPAGIRDNLALLGDDEGILWVMGLAIAGRAKVSDKTRRILKLIIE